MAAIRMSRLPLKASRPITANPRLAKPTSSWNGLSAQPMKLRGHLAEEYVKDEIVEIRDRDREQQEVREQRLDHDRKRPLRLECQRDRGRDQSQHEERQGEVAEHEGDDASHVEFPGITRLTPCPAPAESRSIIHRFRGRTQSGRVRRQCGGRAQPCARRAAARTACRSSGTAPTAPSTPNTRASTSLVMLSPGGPSHAMRPAWSTTIRRPNSAARLRSCRIATTAVPRVGAPARRVEHDELMPQVEARGRLVEQQHARAVRGLPAGKLHQHARQMHALLLAARQGRDAPLAELADVDLGQRGLDQVVEPRSARRRPLPCARSRRP